MPPRDSMPCFCSEIGVCNIQAFETAELQKVLPIIICPPNFVMTKKGRPVVMICNHSYIVVTQDEQLFLMGNIANCSTELFI